jgi:hypothetical protein
MCFCFCFSNFFSWIFLRIWDYINCEKRHFKGFNFYYASTNSTLKKCFSQNMPLNMLFTKKNSFANLKISQKQVDLIIVPWWCEKIIFCIFASELFLKNLQVIFNILKKNCCLIWAWKFTYFLTIKFVFLFCFQIERLFSSSFKNQPKLSHGGT